MSRNDIRSIDSEADALVAIAADKNGDLYGITHSSSLVKIDKTTGEYTTIGPTGVTLDQDFYKQSATFDMRSGKLYWVALLPDSNSALFEVNTTTGKATKIGDLPHGEEVVALYVPESKVADGAPKCINDLQAEFLDGSLSGSVSFTMPENNMIDKALSGEQTYVISVNGVAVLTGNANPGEKVKQNISVKNGENKISVITKNDAGESDIAKVSLWAGYDEPNPIKDINLNIDSETGVANLKWPAVTEGVHGGYIDKKGVKYKIVRQPDNKVVAKAATETSFQETLPTKIVKKYSYDVTPLNGEVYGKTTTSSTVCIGKQYELPYSEDFSDPNVFKSFVTIDANNDTNTWNIGTKKVSYKYSSTNDADDWLLTPEIYMDGTHAVKFSVKAGTTLSSFTERMAIYYGQGDDPTKYTQLVAPVELSSMKTLTADFIPSSAGKYRIGFHAISDKGKYSLDVTDINLTEGALLAGPAVIDNLKATAATDGTMNTTITFTAPTKTTGGNALTNISKIEVYRNDRSSVLLHP
jgi:hypothetical protein